MTRILTNFNLDWLYRPEDNPSFAKPSCPETGFTPVSLPHTNTELPWHNFHENAYAFISWYRKHFSVPASLKSKRLFLDFDGVMIACEVFVNGQKLHTHKGGYTPFSVDITDVVSFGPKPQNTVSVRVDSRERKDIPPFGHVVDYLTFGGIYRDVTLRAVSPLFIENVFPKPTDILKSKKRLDVSITLSNSPISNLQSEIRNPKSKIKSPSSHEGISLSPLHRKGNSSSSLTRCTLKLDLLDAHSKTVASLTSPLIHAPEGKAQVPDLTLKNLSNIRLWDIDNPNLYTLRTTLLQDGNPIDSLDQRIGFRHAVFTPEGPFKLNGKKVNLIGLDRHQTYPFIGQAAPARLQRRDAEILKNELALNIVRTSHYPQSPHFLDACDELGLLVFEEIPGWQHIGNDAWKEVSYDNLRGMIIRDRHHPSIVLWGVRINESDDDHDFYSETDRLSHELDPTRQTGGVRYKPNSELLEDVYTMNDFIHKGGEIILRKQREVTGLKHTVPYLITEFNGHMYPTKPFDQEERMIEHALRHARIQNAAAGDKEISGAIGRCAFDYNTHQPCGSGDRVCYHGVSDIFRQPKFAAWFHESQLDPRIRPVLRLAGRWKGGERDGARNEPILAFSNCDRVVATCGKMSKTGRPDRKNFPHLAHPPIFITGLRTRWGKGIEPLKLVGYIGSRPVARLQIDNDGIPADFILKADHSELIADGADMTQVTFSAADRFGNTLPFATGAVFLSLEGPGELVGENPFALVGGLGACYVRAGRKPGKVTVTAQYANFAPRKVVIKISR